MRKTIFVLLCYLGALAFAPTAYASILFSEVAANPEGSDDGREWMEFYVTEETNLSGWRLHESGVEHRLSLVRGNETVQPESYFIVADNANIFLNETNYSGTLFDSVFSLSNEDETLVFKNATLSINLTYQSVEGKTFCLVNETWNTCEPTPGAENTPVKQNETNVVETPNATIAEKDTLKILSYPQRIRFGSLVYISVVLDVAERVHVYAYGHPKQILADGEGRGVRAGDFDGEMSVLVDGAGQVMVPLLAKNNCDLDYPDGTYKVRVRVVDAIGKEMETEDVWLEFYGTNCAVKLEKVATPMESPAKAAEAKPRVFIVDAPQTVEAGENMMIRAVVLGTDEFEIYSYLRSGKSLASAGGWTGNIDGLIVDEVGFVELQNTPVRTGNLTLVVRLRSGEKNYDATRSLFVVEKNKTVARETEQVQELRKPTLPQKKNSGVWNSFIEMLRGWLR